MRSPVIVSLGKTDAKSSKMPISSDDGNLLQPFVFQGFDHAFRDGYAAVFSDSTVSNLHIIRVKKLPKSGTGRDTPLIGDCVLWISGTSERCFKCVSHPPGVWSFKRLHSHNLA